MNIAELCFRKKTIAYVLAAALAIAGVKSYYSLGRLEDPEYTIRAAQIVTSYPGATAEEVAVFKCTDENAAKTLETAAHTRLESQKAAYADYAPQSVPAIENAIVRQLGEYVICVVADDNAAAEAVLENYIK